MKNCLYSGDNYFPTERTNLTNSMKQGSLISCGFNLVSDVHHLEQTNEELQKISLSRRKSVFICGFNTIFTVYVLFSCLGRIGVDMYTMQMRTFSP